MPHTYIAFIFCWDEWFFVLVFKQEEFNIKNNYILIKEWLQDTRTLSRTLGLRESTKGKRN